MAASRKKFQDKPTLVKTSDASSEVNLGSFGGAQFTICSDTTFVTISYILM